MENADELTQKLNGNLFEFVLKDDFLPIYLHSQYSKIFCDSSKVMEISPDRRRSTIQGTGFGTSTV